MVELLGHLFQTRARFFFFRLFGLGATGLNREQVGAYRNATRLRSSANCFVRR